tara:strand:+ start:298 stop:957 length:660 start_codon:yes stop_codon:yes gene_type:complete
MKTFKNQKYLVIRKAVSKELCLFLYNYLLIKRQVTKTMFDYSYIPRIERDFGTWKDEQVPGNFSCYSDIAMETLMLKVQPIMEKHTKLQLYPNYTYMRIYEKGAELKRHKDRFSCEISTTLNLGGDPWSIYLEPNYNVGIPNDRDITIRSNNKGKKIDLKPGDMLIYLGQELEHWREPFQGNECAQVFLHYNNVKSKNAKENVFDTRKHVGLPSWFKGR